ncbi:MAG: hypothetical protein WD552_02245 [Candidatus Paceibacterota bacterium]
MRRNLYNLSASAAALLAPVLVLAQGKDFKAVVGDVTDFIMTLVPILTSLALLLFFWGLVEYVTKAGSGAEVEASKQRMTWGVVGVFVIVAIWGIVAFVGNSIGFSL